MNRFKSILLPLMLMLAGCHYVHVHVIPDGADITVGQETQHAPAIVTVRPFRPVMASISAKGCATAETEITYSTPAHLDIVLKRKFTAESLPPEADVLLNGSPIGQTPLKFELPADATEAKLTFKKNGFSQQDIQIQPATADQTIFTRLVPDQPGFLFWRLKPTPFGKAKLVSQTVRAQNSFNEPGNRQPLSIVQLGDNQRQILSFGLLPSGKGLLASILVQTQEKPDKYEAQITILPLIPNQQPKILTRGNIDVTPTIQDNDQMIFASNRTGRLDLWRGKLTSEPQKLDLLHSSELIMMDPKIQPKGNNVIITVFQPEKLNLPQIWSFTINTRKNVNPEFFCYGENAAWSPNGRRIAFQKDNPPAIWLIESDGSLMKQLSPVNSPAAFLQPAWSPDGKRIAFTANINAPQNPDDTDIWIMDADGGNLTQVTSSQAYDDMPVWAPDGKSIFFRSNRNLHWGIWNIQVP